MIFRTNKTSFRKLKFMNQHVKVRATAKSETFNVSAPLTKTSKTNHLLFKTQEAAAQHRFDPRNKQQVPVIGKEEFVITLSDTTTFVLSDLF